MLYLRTLIIGKSAGAPRLNYGFVCETEFIYFDSGCFQHSKVKGTYSSSSGMSMVITSLHRSTALSCYKTRKIIIPMLITIYKSTTQHHQTIIEKSFVPFFYIIHP